MPPTLDLLDAADSVAASGDHPLIAHYQPYLVPGRPAYRYGGAVGVVYDYWGDPDVSIVGPDHDAARLAEALADVPMWLSLPKSAAGLLAEGFLAGRHEWEFRSTSRPSGTADTAAAWISGDAVADLAALLDGAFPDASIRPGSPRARRWAGVRDGDGRLVACAADATGNPAVGFVASITTRADLRGRGLGRLLTGWLVDRLVAEHGRAALWLYAGNKPAAAVYDALGMSAEPMVAGALPAAHHLVAAGPELD